MRLSYVFATFTCAGLFCGQLSAAVDEATAAKALQKIVSGMQFQYYGQDVPNPSAATGTPTQQVLSVTWGKTYETKVDDDTYTVFVADAVVGTLYGKYRLKAGIGLTMKGDQTFMEQDFEPTYELIKPTAQELAEQEKEAQLKKYRTDAEAEIMHSFQRINVILHSGLTCHIAPLDNGSTMDSGASPFTNLCLWIQGPVDQFGMGPLVGIRASSDQLELLASALKKWDGWVATAKANQVTNIKKEIPTESEIVMVPIRDNQFTGPLDLEFVVDASGNASLDVDGLSLDMADVKTLENEVSKLITWLDTANKKADEMANAKRAADAQQAEKDAMFK
jgi:hypothetical protein